MKRPRLASIYLDSVLGGRFCSRGSHGSALGTGPLVLRRRPLSLCWVAGVAFRGAEIKFCEFYLSRSSGKHPKHADMFSFALPRISNSSRKTSLYLAPVFDVLSFICSGKITHEKLCHNFWVVVSL